MTPIGVGVFAPPERLTGAIVASWFPASKFGRPAPEQCEALAKSLEADYRADPSHMVPGWGALRSRRDHVFEAVKLAKSLQSELKGALRGGLNPFDYSPEADDYLQATEKFLARVPGRGVGAPREPWVIIAAYLAPEIAAILKQPNKPAPSLNSDNGPVTAVLQKVLWHCYGIDRDPSQIGRRLRSRKVRLGAS